jgi:hypothetical protein
MIGRHAESSGRMSLPEGEPSSSVEVTRDTKEAPA